MAFTDWFKFTVLSNVATKSEIDERIVLQTLPIFLESILCPKIDHNFSNEKLSVQSPTRMFLMVHGNYWILFLSCTILNQTSQRMSLSTSQT